MNNGLSKKEKKAISKAIIEKLTSMGVKNEIQYVASGKKIKRPVFEGNEIKVEDGKVVFEEIDVPIAMNVLRRTVRTLRKAPLEEILAFLNLEMPSSQDAATEQVSAEASINDVPKE